MITAAMGTTAAEDPDFVCVCLSCWSISLYCLSDLGQILGSLINDILHGQHYVGIVHLRKSPHYLF